MSKHLLVFLSSLIFGLLSWVDSQTIWTKYPGNPVLEAGAPGDWDENFIYAPTVLKKDNLYRLWYGVYLSDHNLIGYATSPDGITWTKHNDPATTDPPYTNSDPVITSGSPGEWDHSIVQPSVLWSDGDSQFHMWYLGTEGPVSGRIGYATSPDGIIWTKYNDPATTNVPYAESDPVLVPGPPGSWEARWVGNPCVLLIGGVYHMWYIAYSGSGSVTAMGHATSNDGITWVKDPANPVMSPMIGTWEYPELRNPAVYYSEADSLFHMWYSGGSFYFWKTGHATSMDGSTWVRDPYHVPVLTPGAFGSWDDLTTSWATVIFDPPGTFKMWYSGCPDGNHGHIGYATSPVVINVPGNAPTIQAGIDSASDGDIVLVEEGTYYENIRFRGKAITVASRFLMDGDTSHIGNTIIDGSQSSDPDSGSVVYFVSGEDTNSVLKGFTITGGTGTKYTYASTSQHTGGGVFLWSGGKVENNKIVNNHLTNANNRYTHGAGLEVIPDGNAIIKNNLIANNSIDAWWGGGAGLILGCADNGYILFENNQVINNTYNASGGHCVGGIGIFSDIGFQGPIYVNANLIKGNQAYSTTMNMALGGGIYIEHASPVLTNNVITENITNGWGGGINVTYWIGFSTIPADPHIINNTIYHNVATWGGGISVRGNHATPLMMNTILWGDSALLDDEIHLTTGGNISVVYSDIEGGYDGEGNVSKEPMLRGENFVLSDSSSCIGAGILSYQFGSTICYAPSCCYLGHSRPSTTGLPPDIGACESPLDAPLVGLERQLLHNLPSVYDLKPNYPNPFNPKTTIAFDLPRRSEVTLKIFNILGEEVNTLLSTSLSAGSYSFDWDASGLASGVYLYRLEAEGYVETRKMVLMK